MADGTVETPSVSTVEDAVEILRIALALGMDVPIPDGMTIYSGNIPGVNGDPLQFGVFMTEEAANTAIRNWIIGNWSWLRYDPVDDTYGTEGWSDEQLAERREAWVSVRTSEEIINHYNAVTDSYEVHPQRYVVSTTPTPLMK